MQELLLINPRKRRAAKKRASPKKRASARRAKRKTVTVTAKVNPVKRRVMRRRAASSTRKRRSYKRNPIGSVRNVGKSIFGSIMPMVKDAVIGAAGSVAVDYLAGKVRGSLPAALNTGYAYDATKALATVALGVTLKGVTRGASLKMAQGALTVQADRIVRSMLPATVASGMGYALPTRTTTLRTVNAPLSMPGTMGAIGNFRTPGMAGFAPVKSVRTLAGADKYQTREGFPR
jgi:uncharacterized membrane protein YgdD (TMEM256/DUF423 family)